MRDSETGKRYGRRDPEGRIIEAYGFDLSPLAYRHDEFIRIAAEAKAEREQMKGLRKAAPRAPAAPSGRSAKRSPRSTPCPRSGRIRRRDGRAGGGHPPRAAAGGPGADRQGPRKPEFSGGCVA